MVKIFVFKVDSKNEGILVDKMSLLSLKEREKLSKYKYDKDRNLSLAGRLMLYCFAERFKDEKYGEVNFVNDLDEFCKENLSDLEIVYGEIGKGEVKDRDDLFFNISHSKEYCVLALSDEEIGVDIQEIKDIRADIAGRFFEKRDNDYIDSEEDKKRERFIEVWCAKESYAKLTGQGIGEGFSTFYENFDKMELFDSKSNELKGYLKRYVIDPDYVCFAASRNQRF